MLQEKRILLIIAGGIAAYKSLELIRRLSDAGASTRCVLTAGGAEFVTPLSVAALSGDQVSQELFDLKDESEMGHIKLSREADIVVVAPATADLMSKMAAGSANDLASTLLLATDKPVLMAPAMNTRMWEHPATRRNIARLLEDGVLSVGPGAGDLACGEVGAGRMSEPMEIVHAIEAALLGGAVAPGMTAQIASPSPLAGRRALVTSGPTHEAIDPVRYIANRSSGRQGHAIAEALARDGAETILVAGPTSQPDPRGVTVVNVESARDMLAACQQSLPVDIAVCAAAVADWRVDVSAGDKMKKDGSGKPPALALVENPDILATIAGANKNRPELVIGFAAETNDVIDYARAKLTRKACDWIVANDVSHEHGVMGGAENTVHLITADDTESWPKMDKAEVAARLSARVAQALNGGGGAK
jgi:phosphopantothenoylcysteine decarboxylase/phosphopantothenate--cysteine ligase